MLLNWVVVAYAPMLSCRVLLNAASADCYFHCLAHQISLQLHQLDEQLYVCFSEQDMEKVASLEADHCLKAIIGL